MSEFLKRLYIFTLPVFLLGGSIEVLIRNIPNDYLYKREYLDKNAADIEVLFLGSSHAYRDVNPVYINANSFNAAYVSQSLEYDYKILEKYKDDWLNLKYIVIPVSYFSLFTTLENSPESWRIKNYSIYYSMRTTCNIEDYFELFSNRLDINFERIYSYYWDGKTNITSSALGWGGGDELDVQLDLVEKGRTAAQRHTAVNDGYFYENVDILRSIVSFADKNNVKIIFYTPPAFKTYFENLNGKQLSRTIATMMEFDSHYANVTYVNYLTSDLFNQEDFLDADHLNALGARKFTLEIGKLIDYSKIRHN